MVTAMGTEVDGTAVTGFEYAYRTDGNQVSKLDTIQGKLTQYTYDGIGQLIHEGYTDADGEIYYSRNYLYDANGNAILKLTYDNGTGYTTQSRYTAGNRIVHSIDSRDDYKTLYTYDNHGNTIRDGFSYRTYDHRDRQTSYNDTTNNLITRYRYYVDGLRKSKKIGENETQYFIWHNGNMVYEFTNSDSNTYAYGLQIFASDDTRYLLNAHGDVVALLNSNGEVTKWYEYDAFGNELNIDENDSNPFRYCGEYFDKETGTIYLRARYYSPVRGRFTTVDPIRDGLNWYAYCGNSPIIYEDPLGLDAIVANQTSNIAGQGHMSAFVEDGEGRWYFFYWGNNAVSVTEVDDTSIFENPDKINEWLIKKGLMSKDSPLYDDFCYIEGDFSESKEYYDDLKKHFDRNALIKNYGWFGFKNKYYNLFTRNCAQETLNGLYKGTLIDGSKIENLFKEYGYWNGIIPNGTLKHLQEVIGNSSHTKSDSR